MKKPVVVILCLLFTLPLFSQTAAEYANKAREKAVKKDYSLAVGLYDKAIALNPNISAYHVSRGFCLYNSGEHKQAKEDMEQLPELFKDSIEVYFKVARFFNEVKDFEKSVEIFDNMLKIFPAMDDTNRMNVYILRGTNKHNMYDLAGAKADYEQAAGIDSNNVHVMLSLAGVYDDLGNQDEAVRLMKKVLVKDPENETLYNNLGFVYINMGKYKEAIEVFDKSIEINKKRKGRDAERTLGFTYSNRGFAKHKLGDDKGALKDFERSIELAPDNSYVYKNRAITYIAINKMSEACADLHLAKALGFTQMYGDEVEKLLKAYCR